MCPQKSKRFWHKTLQDIITDSERLGIEIPFSEKIDVLAQPVEIDDCIIPNRIAAHPMEGCDGTSAGRPGDLTTRRYIRMAEGGYGLIWFEATAVAHEGKSNPRQLLLTAENPGDFKKLLELVIEKARAKFGADFKPYTVLQLTHSGRFSRPDSVPRPIIAAENPYLDKKIPVENAHIISDEEIEEIEERFTQAAVMAGEAGFDAVDIKSCHGYLNSELLSARTRDGKYGGSFENRTRFLLNIVDKIQGRTSGKPAVAVRLNAYDGVPFPYGWGVDSEDFREYDISEPLRLVEILAGKGVRLINLSAGIPCYNPHIGRPYDKGPYVPDEHPLYGVARLLKIGREIQGTVPEAVVVATGFSWLKEFGANCAAGGISEGWFAIAGFGRQVFAYPGFPRDIFNAGKMVRKKCCVACGKCTEIMRHDGMTGCVVRDSSIYLPIYRKSVKCKG